MTVSGAEMGNAAARREARWQRGSGAFGAAYWTVLSACIVFALAVAISVLAAASAEGAQAGRCGGVWVCTGYSWREPSHKRWGQRNAIGGSLARPAQGMRQVAANYLPIGTVVEIEGLGRRIVTDRIGACRGPGHLDVHFETLTEMRAWGTQRRVVRVVRRGWGRRRRATLR